MIEKLREWSADRGYRVAWGPGSLVESVQEEISGRKDGSEIDPRFFELELESVVGRTKDPPEWSVVVVAMPRPAHSVCFDVDGKDCNVLLPPTYFRYRATFEDLRMDLAENALPGVQLEYLAAPLKAVAARLGLVRYGRNNISYMAGAGSYLQLCGYRVGLPFPELESPETEPGSLLPQCENCGICAGMCPTDAITQDRVLIRAERCLTFLNENSGDWPDWLSPQAHTCLLGCLECQRPCPANPELPVEHTGLRFTADETRVLLSGKPTADNRAETGIRMKLAWLGQPYVESVLGRNLRALLNSGSVKV
jgi:epoxyqueuosine reductase